MKDPEKKGITDFKNFYRSLSDTQKIQLRNIIIESCGFSLSTFYYKLEKNSFKKLEMTSINQIISENMNLST